MLNLLFASLAIAAGDGLPLKTPASVGMSAERLRAIDRVVTRGISAGGFPGAAVVVGRKGAAVWQKGFGRIDWRTSSSRVSPTETFYDLASLTKVIATTTAVMILFDEGRISLDAPVQTYLPAFVGNSKDLVTVRHLLTHRSGLPASRDLWRITRTPEEARRVVVETPLQCSPGACFVYSDLGAIVLAMIVESVSGTTLDVFVNERVFHPLGMTNTFFRPADALRERAAPTEVTPPRGYPLRGEVHDENAYALGGVAGHAGLFSTAADLSIFAQMLLNGGEYNGVRVVSDSAIQIFSARTAGNRALGWASADGSGGSGQYFTDNAYGHTGFTGTSMWLDPDREMFVVLLTNRVHAARARRPGKVISDVRADLADAAAIAVMDNPDMVLSMPRAFRADRAVGWNRPARVYRRHAKSSRRSAAYKASKARKAAAARKARASKASKARTAKAAKSRVTSASKAKARKPVVSKPVVRKKVVKRNG
ncbi:MAG: serine hydrolase domain-containing protein [Gemmatimonadaceae bacterium]